MKRIDRSLIVFACCVLSMPTCAKLMTGFRADTLQAALTAGAVLGAAHLLLRPILRIVSVPIGCLTLGLVQPAIDIALIYACSAVVEGFYVTNILHALLATALINSISLIATGRR